MSSAQSAAKKSTAAVAKGFVDDLDTVVSKAVSGLTRFSGGTLKHLVVPGTGELAGNSSSSSSNNNNVHVVVRGDFEEYKASGRVAIVSGGGAGHEPLHAGFVGKDLLTAAVSGDIFASPSTDAVLHAIVTVTGEGGCLVVVKNYTGDRLNFGLAIERARALYGLKVEMVVVADDVALPHLAQPRGIAGTCLVHKVAGYAADTLGRDLAFVTQEAQKVADSVRSLGVSLSVCSIPGQPINPRLDDSTSYELGLGIHGEPGAKSGAMRHAEAGGDGGSGGSSRVVEELIDTLLRNGRLLGSVDGNSGISGAEEAKPRFALLVNNLGAVPPLYISAVAEKAISYLQGHYGLFCEPVGGVVMIGAYVTSLDMNGFSLSLLRVDATSSTEAALLHPVSAQGWTPARVFNPHSKDHTVQSQLRITDDTPSSTKQPKLSQLARSRIVKAMKHLETIAGQLDEWDARVGDGDCGRTVAKGARAIGHDVSHYPADSSKFCAAVAESLKGMGGSFGVLLCIFFSAAATELAAATRGSGSKLDTANDVSLAFNAGLTAVMKYGGAQRGGCTMVDALFGAQDALRAAGADAETKDIFGILARGAEAGVEVTKAASAASGGRAMYQTKDLSGIPDPGAFAVMTVLQQLAVE